MTMKRVMSVALVVMAVAGPAGAERCAFFPPTATNGGGVVPLEPPPGGGCSARDCGEHGPAAILLTGYTRGDAKTGAKLEKHLEAVASNVARPLNAHVFVVFEVGNCPPMPPSAAAVAAARSGAGAAAAAVAAVPVCTVDVREATVEAQLRAQLGASLRAIGIVEASDRQGVRRAPASVPITAELVRTYLPAPAATGAAFRLYDKAGTKGATKQWCVLAPAQALPSCWPRKERCALAISTSAHLVPLRAPAAQPLPPPPWSPIRPS